MNILSLFDGISSGMVALERAGIKVDKYYASEIDNSAIEISSKNYPNIIQLGDITKIDETILNGLEKIDLILAGSPCQGFSRQGNCLNFEHPQSKLFFDFVKILSWIRENNNPNVKFLLENVEMKKEWRDVITGYVGVQPMDINSKLMSAQNRPRTYWTNIENVDIPHDSNVLLKDILLYFDNKNLKFYNGIYIDKSLNEKEISLIEYTDGVLRIKQATKNGYIIANDGDGINLSFPTSKTRRGRVINKKSSTLDKSCNVCVYYDGIIRRLTIDELERLQTLPSGYTEGVAESHRRAAIGNGWTVDIITYILSKLIK